jgi:hypothetical protein
MCGKPLPTGFRTVPHFDTICRILFRPQTARFRRRCRRHGNHLFSVIAADEADRRQPRKFRGFLRVGCRRVLVTSRYVYQEASWLETMGQSARNGHHRTLINAKGVSDAPAERSEPVAHSLRAHHNGTAWRLGVSGGNRCLREQIVGRMESLSEAGAERAIIDGAANLEQ